jgi:hypothetical protein
MRTNLQNNNRTIATGGSTPTRDSKLRKNLLSFHHFSEFIPLLNRQRRQVSNFCLHSGSKILRKNVEFESLTEATIKKQARIEGIQNATLLKFMQL